MARRSNFDPDEVLDPDELEERLEEEGNDGILKGWAIGARTLS